MVKRKPFIVLEGPDGSGKTTLAEALSKELGFDISHYGAPNKPALDFYSDEFIKHPYGGAILDRYHIGSFVYGLAFRNGDDLNEYERWLLEGRLLSYNSLVIYVRPSDDNISNKILDLRASSIEYEAINKQDEVRKLYDVYFDNLITLPYLKYDFTQPDALEDIVSEINNLITYFDGCVMPMDSSNPFGNQYSPKIALIGASPSRYMFNVLRAANLPLNQVCLIGENFPSKFEPSLDWVNTEFVACGDAAVFQLGSANIKPHRKVLRPEDVEINFYNSMTRYARAIKGEERWEPIGIYS